MPRDGEKPKNYVELTKDMILEKVKDDLTSLKKEIPNITTKKAKTELEKINDWLQWTNNLAWETKEIIWNNINNLILHLEWNIEENIEKSNLESELNEMITMLENLTQKDLADLKRDIQHNNQQRRIPSERPTEVQDWLDAASNNLKNLPNDNNPIANWALKKIREYLW